MVNEVHLPIMFAWIELEINNHDIVYECEDKESLFIAYELFHGEHIPAVISSKTCKGPSRKAFAIHVFVNLSLKFYHVEELDDCKEETDQQQSIVCNQEKYYWLMNSFGWFN